MSETDPKNSPDAVKRSHELRAGYDLYHKMGRHALNWLDSEYRFNKADAKEREAGRIVNEHQDAIEVHARSEMEADLSSRKIV